MIMIIMNPTETEIQADLAELKSVKFHPDIFTVFTIGHSSKTSQKNLILEEHH